MWLAPNMVTLLGFMFIIANVALCMIYTPDLVGPGPSSLYFSFAFGLWMYQTMDNIDGKQARRTQQSSGLGELFDHGIDSLNCTLASFCETSAVALGHTPAGAFTALVPCLPMFFSTWETYHTHTLYLGYFNGPTEGLLLACTFMIISGIHGPQFWYQQIADVFGYSHIFGTYKFIDFWLPMLFVSFFIVHLPACVYNVIRARRAQKLPIAPIFLDWFPMIVYSTSICAWLGSPHSTLLRDQHLGLFCLTLSFVFGRMTTKIILAHLTRQPFPYWTVLLVPLIGGSVMANLPYFGYPAVSALVELTYLRAYFVFAVVVYFRWATVVISSICSYLDINCLTITPKGGAGRRKASRRKAE
jgi:ethanolaminephosphotransferase